jgi:cytochrome c-type biogenesis protein CcmH/NrfG
MTRPPKSQILLEIRASVRSHSAPAEEQKCLLAVTPHRLWISENHEILVADLLSVRLTKPDTVSVRQIGKDRPTDFQCRKPADAQQLRACLVFHAKYTRGGIPGVETWTQLTHPPYDRIDISDASLPAAASPAVDASSVATTAALAGKRSRTATIVATACVALVLIVVIVVTLASRRGPASPGVSANSAEAGRLADEAFARGEFAAAVGHYRAALDSQPSWAEGWAKLGRSLIHEGQADEAVDALEKAIRLSDRPPTDLSATLARSYLSKGKGADALRVVDEALRAAPEEPELTFLKASVLSSGGPLNATNALKLSRRVYQSRPDLTENTRLLASLLEKTRSYGEASRMYLEVARKTKDGDAFLAAVRTAGKANRLGEASHIITEARAAFPQREEWREKTNDQVLVALGLMKPPDEPAAHVEPTTKEGEPAETEPTQEPKTPEGETTPAKDPTTGTETPPGTETTPGTEMPRTPKESPEEMPSDEHPVKPDDPEHKDKPTVPPTDEDKDDDMAPPPANGGNHSEPAPGETEE